MLEISLAKVGLLLVWGIVLIFFYAQPRKKLPPGPRGIPIFGNLFQMIPDMPVSMTKWAKQFGKMYTLRLGSNVTIVLNDFKLVKEVMSDNNFSSRPSCEVIEMLTGGPYGILNTSGVKWEEQRRWSLRTLRDFGFGKTSMEGVIMEDVNELTEIIKVNANTPFKVSEYIDLAVLNSLWTLLNGKRLKQSDPQIKEVMKLHHVAIEACSNSGLMFAPWLKYIFPSSSKAVKEGADKLMNFCKDAVRKHWESHQDGVTRDFIDAYISEIKTTKDPSSAFFGSLGRKNLKATVSDLLQAGLETTSNTLLWLLCYLTEYPEIQVKLQKEIERVIGSSNQVGLADKENLPYVEATILETLRYSSIVAIGVQRSAIEDKYVEGYTIPKGCWILPNIYYVHHDPAIWGDPENFRPERFLSADGTKVVKHEALIPFQIGRRQCIGESLAKDTLFLFTAHLCQRFKIERLEKEKPEYKSAGNMIVPKNYNFIFKSN